MRKWVGEVKAGPEKGQSMAHWARRKEVIWQNLGSGWYEHSAFNPKDNQDETKRTVEGIWLYSGPKP
jgi:hypothetical protein